MGVGLERRGSSGRCLAHLHALGTGPGSELRRPLGIAIIGGLLLSQFLTLYTTPVIYVALDRVRALLHYRMRMTQEAAE